MGKFSEFAAAPGNPNWEQLVQRDGKLDVRTDDVRSPFARDYTRILHSRGYRRMKHKTQVFFNIDKDHICTRMEHVAHVESVSGTIAGYLGLNTELTKAISIGHDIGHAPFGHQGERVLDKISRQYLKKSFWHEKNGLNFVDKRHRTNSIVATYKIKVNHRIFYPIFHQSIYFEAFKQMFFALKKST